MYIYDREFMIEHSTANFAGIDEAGRGPLAGPVCAAAVILDTTFEIPGINDSKKLTEKKREILFDIILDKAVAYGIGWASPAEIDEINILNATYLAMRRAVAGLQIIPQYLAVDGSTNPMLGIPTTLVVKGDSKSASIGAASILAKVSRDRKMVEYGKKYPEYEYHRHKGYPTKLHYEKLELYGPSEIHRSSFLRKWEARQNGRVK